MRGTTHGGARIGYIFYDARFFEKIGTYDKITFPQQANSIVRTEGVLSEIAPKTFFLQKKPKFIFILIQL